MMIKSSSFFLFYYLYLFIGSSTVINQEIVDSSIGDNNRIKYPWMVMIYRLDPLSVAGTYGTIIHERMILAVPNPIVDIFEIFEYRVWVDCFTNFTRPFMGAPKIVPPGLKKIKEYHQLKISPNEKLEFLILAEPLKLNDTINIIPLFHEPNSFDPQSCILLYPFSQWLVDEDTKTVNEVFFFTSYAVQLNQTHLEVMTSPTDPLIPLDQEGRLSITDKDRFKEKSIIKFIGSPLYCQSSVSNRWGQIAVTDLVMKVQGIENPRLILEGSIIRIDNKHMYDIFNVIAKSSGIYNFQLPKNEIRY